MKFCNRLKSLVLGDVRFHIKYGFYFIYAITTAFYIFIILIMPESIKEHFSFVMIFSDPAALGLFFMGGIILLEKSEKTINTIAVSPISVKEYILSKMISLGLVSVLVAVILAFVSGVKNISAVAVGTFLTSCIFTLIGLIIGAKTKNLNQYIFSAVPFEVLCFTPPILTLFNINIPFIKYYPFYACLSLIMNENILLNLFIITLTIIILFIIALRYVGIMFNSIE